jgi:hypothetical protein
MWGHRVYTAAVRRDSLTQSRKAEWDEGILIVLDRG